MNDLHDDNSKRCIKQLSDFGFRIENIYYNLSTPDLVENSIKRNEGALSSTGSLVVKTGRFTGRSPDDKYIVYDSLTHNIINWGKVNHPISEENFERIFSRMKKFAKDKEFFVFDGFIGADKNSRLPIRIVTDKAWHSLFASQIFIKPNKKELELEHHLPKFTLFAINDFSAIPEYEGTNTETFIILNLSKGIILIGATSYAGEIKKALFSVMNFLLPRSNIFPMHCSANMGKNGDTALFFGLSGTGKTTLSADPNRFLIGDDEHGWSQTGVFNFEGGCYAKCINLKKEHEPQIWNAIRFGTVMENVVLDEKTRIPDFSDSSLTENTRVVYPLEFIPGALKPSIGSHPKVIIFLTADAFGVMPPISKLSREGAMYHFMSGYTSKLAGTERGITEPKETFSQCFGAPFMPLHAMNYAQMLGERISKYNTKVYLINTGWSGGPYGIGKRMELKYTRAMVTAAIDGTIENTQFSRHEIFNLLIPNECPNVPTEILDPKRTWNNEKDYELAAKRLASLFKRNFEKFGSVANEIVEAGPK